MSLDQQHKFPQQPQKPSFQNRDAPPEGFYPLQGGPWPAGTGQEQPINSRASGSFLYHKGRYLAGSCQAELVILLILEEASSCLLVHLCIALPKAQQAALLDYNTANFVLLWLKKKKKQMNKKSQMCWWMLMLPLSWQTPSPGTCELLCHSE